MSTSSSPPRSPEERAELRADTERRARELRARRVASAKAHEIVDHSDDVFERAMRRRGSAKILEIGSRRVVQSSPMRARGLDVTGLDICEGPDVDVVGDVHDLSALFPPESFDGVCSYAVFEHVAMPWKAALEINRVLKPGGLCYVASHQTFPVHELPWDFWRYGLDALEHAFCDAAGYSTWLRRLSWSSHLVAPIDKALVGSSDVEHECYLFTSHVAMKVGAPDPARVHWPITLPELLPRGHFYPKDTYQYDRHNYQLEYVPPRVAEEPELIDRALAVIRRDPSERGLVLTSTPDAPAVVAFRANGAEVLECGDEAALDAAIRRAEAGPRLDHLVLVDVLDLVRHPWSWAPRLLGVLRVGGSLYVRAYNSRGFQGHGRDLFRFTYESFRVLFPPAFGVELLEGAFVEPLDVVADEDESVHHQAVLHAPCFRHAVAVLTKTRHADLSAFRWQ